MATKDEMINALRQIQSLPNKDDKIIALRELKTGSYAAPGSGFDIDISPMPVDRRMTTASGEDIQNRWGTLPGSEQSQMLREQIPGQAGVTTGGLSTVSGEQAFYRVPEERQKRAEAGVDIYSGAPISLRAKTSLVPKQEQATFIKEQIEDALGYKTDVRKVGNDLEFLRKTDDGRMRWTSINETGLSTGDIVAAMETGPALIGDVAGSLAPLRYTTKMGAPAATVIESAGAAAGTTAMEAARLGAGKALGYHEAEVWPLALEEGGKAGAASLVAGSVMGGGQRLIRGAQGGLNRTDIENILDMDDPVVADAQEMINRRLREGEKEPKLVLTTGQRSRDERIADIERTARSRTETAERQARDIDVNQRQAFDDYLDLLTGRREADYSEAGRALKREVSEPARQQLLNIRQKVRDYTGNVEATLADLPSIDVSKMATDMRMSAVEQRRLIKEVEAAKWKKIEADAGYNPETDQSDIIIPRSDEVNAAVRGMSKKVENALFPSEATTKKGLIERLRGEDTTVLGENALSKIVSGVKSEFDLVPLNRSISYLKKLKRQSDSGLHPDLPGGHDIDSILQPLERMRNESLAKTNPALLKTIQDAQDLTVERVNMFDKGAIGRILRKDNGKYHLDDRGVLSTIFAKQNGQAAREYATAVIEDPRAMQAARNHINAIYRESVAPDGIPDRKLHKKFMSNYKDVMQPFFKAKDYKKIKSLGRLGDVVNSYGKRLEKVEKNFTKAFRGRIESMSPEHTVPAFFKDKISISDVQTMRDYLAAGDVRSLARYKSSLSKELEDRMRSSGRLSSKNIDAMLKKTNDLKGRGKLRAMYGGQFVADLRLLSKVVSASEKKGKALEASRQSREAVAAKAVLGPLHPQSRLVTFFDRLKRRASDKEMYNIMSDPKKLRSVLKNKDIDATSRRAYQLYSSLGALSALDSGDERTPQ